MKIPHDDNLKPLMHCPVCNRKYAPSSATPLAQDDERSTVHLSCSACGVSSIVFVSANSWGVASVGVLTDLQSEEARKRFGTEAVSVDQVLDLHTFLKEYKGRLKDIL